MDQCFRGDAECLVDRLIEASRIPSFEGSLFERELQPWCPDEDSAMLLEEPLEARHRTPSKYARSPAKRTRAPGSPQARRCSLDAAHGFACPSFNAAPKPEALPVPALLARALYRRSPSPPKFAAAMA